jgi:hypothetical protein
MINYFIYQEKTNIHQINNSEINIICNNIKSDSNIDDDLKNDYIYTAYM